VQDLGLVLVRRGGGAVGDDPDWVYRLNREEIDVMAGRCFTELKQPGRAEPLLRSASGLHSDKGSIKGRAIVAA
jgi:hypothetical protein